MNTPAKTTADEIRQLHDEINGIGRAALDKAIRIGELLTAKKADLGHGKWLPWVESEALFSARTATRYLGLYENREKVKSASVSDLTEAYRLLAPPGGLPPAKAQPDEDGPEKREMIVWAITQYGETWGVEEIAQFCHAQAETVRSIWFKACQEKLESSMPAFLKACTAIAEVKAREMYRHDYESWEAWCAHMNFTPELADTYIAIAKEAK